MRTRTAAIAAVTAAGLALAPMAGATAVKPDPKPKAEKTEKVGFAVTKLKVVGKKTVDVADQDATIKVRAQVKDKSKAFDPSKVRITLVEKVSGAEDERFTVTAKLAGKSKKVSNWVGKVNVPQDSVAEGTEAVYCVKLVKVVADDPSEEPVVAQAKGLQGKDCVTVVNVGGEDETETE
jgi:hypothetical protein